MVLAADYPFLGVLWSMIIFFAWVVWIWMMVVIPPDFFRGRDTGGGGRGAWVVFLIVLPFLGVLVSLTAQHDGMAERNTKQAEAINRQFDERVREASSNGGAAAEIEKAQQLLSSGAINQNEYDALKTKALAAA